MTKQSDDVEAVKQMLQAWHAGCQNSDIYALLALYEDTTVWMLQGQPEAIGKKANRSLYEEFFTTNTVNGACELQDVEVPGDWGYFWAR